MRALPSCWILSLCVALPVLTANGAPAQPLRMGGTGTANELLRQVGAEFATATGIKIEIVPGLGSTGAIRAIADGMLDIAVSARPLKGQESAAGLSQLAVLRTAFVIATSHRNPNGLRSADLPGIFAAEKPTWADGTPIRIILRPRSEADTALLARIYTGMGEALEVVRKRAEVPIAATDQDNLEMAERTPGSLVGTTMAQLKMERPKLSVISLDGVEPTLANLESGAYRFEKKLHFFVRSSGRAEARRFTDFLRSPQGVQALRKAETLPERE